MHALSRKVALSLLSAVLVWTGCSRDDLITGPVVPDLNTQVAPLSIQYTGYTLEDLGTLGGSWSEALGVNDAGWVVGVSETATGDQHAFLWTPDGGMQSMGVPSRHYSSYCFGVNDAGELVGMALSRYGNWNAVVWRSPNNYEVLGSLGGRPASPWTSTRWAEFPGSRLCPAA